MRAWIPNRSKPKSLTARIRDAERQVSKRQRGVGVRAAVLVRKIHQQMTAPATLLLAGGIGFIIGELTARAPKVHGTADTPSADETPLMTALNLLTSVRTLYTALPIAWMMKSYHQPDASGKARKRRSQPVAGSSGASHRRSRR